MRGSIRIFLGFILVLGGAGSFESIESPILPGLLVAILGLALMYWGSRRYAQIN